MAVPNNSKAEKQLTTQEKLDKSRKETKEKFNDTVTGKNKATTDPSKELDDVRSGKDKETTAKKDGDGGKETAKETKKNYIEVNKDLVAVEPNVMDQFRTHSQIWSLFILTPEEASKPDETYMLSEPMINIIKGAGGSQNIKSGRRATTLNEDQNGRVEYYIDNVSMQSVLQPGGMGSRMPAVHQFSFEVTEPYSMGMFMESLQVGAVTAGYKQYISAPLLLMCEFIGHKDDNTTERVAIRRFPIQLSGANVTVNAGGTKYEVTAVSRNGACYTDAIQMLQTDVTVVGGTLEEALQSGSQSLTRIMNTTLLEREESETEQFADEYIIMFPKEEDIASARSQLTEEENTEKATYDPQAAFESRYGKQQGVQNLNYEEWFQNVTGFGVKRSKTSDALRTSTLQQENISEIGKATLLEQKLEGGEVKPATYYGSYDKEKGVFEQGQVAIPTDKRAFKFTKGTKLNEIIEEMVIASSYGRGLLTQDLDEEGYRRWFTIQGCMYDVPVKQVEDSKARMPKIYVFKVIPYKVHSSVWQAPQTVTEGQVEIKRKVRKAYNYIYTGKNKDILDFDIKYETRFLTPTPMDKAPAKPKQDNPFEQKTGQEIIANAQGKQEEPKANPLKVVGQSDIAPITSGVVGANKDAKDKIAREFHKALINSTVDLINAKITIMGDPWYLSDSGLGNYQAKAGVMMFDDERKQMDYIRQQVFIYLNFRTPFDYDPVEAGGLLTSKGEMLVKHFSGLYRVVELQSNFSSGQFTQELTLIRAPNQTELDTEQEPDGTANPTEKKPAPKGDGPDKKNHVAHETQVMVDDFSAIQKKPIPMEAKIAELRAMALANQNRININQELIDQFNAGADITEDLESSVNLAVNEIKGRLT